jgi:hypothetical protein
VTPSRIVAALAVLVGLATLARATRCTAGGELLIGITLTGVLAAVWNDNREGGLAARIAKFIIVLALAGGFVGFFAVALHVRCVRVVGPAWPRNSYGRDSLGLRVGLVPRPTGSPLYEAFCDELGALGVPVGYSG